MCVVNCIVLDTDHIPHEDDAATYDVTQLLWDSIVIHTLQSTSGEDFHSLGKGRLTGSEVSAMHSQLTFGDTTKFGKTSTKHALDLYKPKHGEVRRSQGYASNEGHESANLDIATGVMSVGAEKRCGTYAHRL